MPESVDHLAQARRIMTRKMSYLDEHNDPHGAATAHATIALAEQTKRLTDLLQSGLKINGEFGGNITITSPVVITKGRTPR